MFKSLFGKGNSLEVERKAHFEQYLTEFETLVGRKFSDRPKIEVLQREPAVEIGARFGAKLFLYSYSIICDKKPEQKTLQDVYETVYRELLKEEKQSHLFDYDSNTVQIVSSVPSNVDLQMFWFSLGQALLYDFDRSFGKLFPPTTGTKSFMQDAFTRGFAGYCSNVLAGAKGLEAVYKYDRQGPLNLKKLEDDYLIALEKILDIRDKAKTNILDNEKVKLTYEIMEEYGKILRLNQLVGFAYIDNIIYLKSASMHGATPDILIDALLRKKKPDSIDDLFFYNRGIPDIDLSGVDDVFKQIHDSRNKSGDKGSGK